MDQAQTYSAEFAGWRPPQINALIEPKTCAVGHPQHGEERHANFFRCVKWCPDGSQMLAQCEDQTLQFLRLPPDLAETTLGTVSMINGSVFPQAAPILDFAWYPGAMDSDPSTLCFLASVRECPVKLLDAQTGRLRASYKIVDHRERQVAPHSLAFNPLASHFYCGYEDAIEVFDLQRPGEGLKIPTTPSKKSKDGMKGIISSIAFCTDHSGLFAASSLSSAVALFSESTGADPVAYLDGMQNAITQVKFDPLRPHLLYAAQRRSSELLCWDVREPHEVARRLRAPSTRRTNQKSIFDIDPSGRWLSTGEEDGCVSVFDLHSESEEPALRFQAHGDSIGSAVFNPLDASLLTVSGSRHFGTSFQSVDGFDSSDDRSDRTSINSEDSDTEPEMKSVYSEDHSTPTQHGEGSSEAESSESLRSRVHTVRLAMHSRPFVLDNSAKIWQFDKAVQVQECVMPAIREGDISAIAHC